MFGTGYQSTVEDWIRTLEAKVANPPEYVARKLPYKMHLAAALGPLRAELRNWKMHYSLPMRADDVDDFTFQLVTDAIKKANLCAFACAEAETPDLSGVMAVGETQGERGSTASGS